MTLPVLCRVTGNVANIGLIPAVGLALYIVPEPNSVRRASDVLIVPEPVSATVSSAGEIDVSLIPGRYSISVRQGSGILGKVFITVPSSTVATIAQLLDAPVPATLSAAQLAVLDAQSARDAANVSAAAADADRIAAEAARSASQAARDAAAASQTAAAGSATQADASKVAAAASATASAGSAAASAASAATASTKAAEADAARIASEAAEAAAAASEGAADASADAALSSEQQAAGSASTALNAKDAAIAAKTAAEAAEVASEGSADAAAASASAASASASASANSATSAAGSATATAADRVATGNDRTASAASAAAALASEGAAASSASASAASATASQTSRLASEAARDGSVAARAATETARDAAVVARTGAETARTGAAAAQAAALVSQTSANTSAGQASGSAAQALAIYGSAAAQQTAVATAQAQASLAAGFAASAASVVQQDLSGVTAQALHRSPNAVTAMAIYDTSKDSDGGAWTEKCQHTSWWNEPIMGKWLTAGVVGGVNSEIVARALGGALGSNLIASANNTTTGWVAQSGALSFVGGRLRLTNPAAGGNGQANWTQAVTAGKQYLLKASGYFGTSTAFPTVRVSDNGGGTWAVLANNSPVGCYVITPGTSSIIIQFGNQNTQAGWNVEFADFSLQEVSGFASSGDYFQLTTDGKFYRLWKNLLTQTEDLTTVGGWSFTSATSAGGATDPDGGATAFTLTATANNANILRASNAARIGTQYANSFYIRRVSGSGAVALYRDTGAETAITLTSSWARYSNTWTATGTNGYVGVKLAVSGDVIEIWHPQQEIGTVETTYEPKTTSGTTSEVFRGNKRDFPRLAGIVAEASSVTIYDLTEPGRPMWMRFLAGVGAGDGFFLSNGGSHTVSALNGVIAIGQVSQPTLSFYGHLRIANFAADRMEKRTGFYNTYAIASFGISTRNTNIGFGNTTDGSPSQVFSGGGIIDGRVNSIAMTVLPDAPVDPVTGLRVPTIAVATSGGVSVIRQNGTVVNITSGGGGSSIVAFLENGSIFSSSDTSGTPQFQSTFLVNKIPTVSLETGSFNNPTASSEYYAGRNRGTPDIRLGSDIYLKGNVVAVTRNKTVLLANHQNGYGTGLGVYGLTRKPSIKSGGLVKNVTDTFNTGWMTGDIRRAYLSDAEVGTVTGPELVVNGTFDADTAWTKGVNTTISGGTINFNWTAFAGMATQSIPFGGNRRYRIRFDVTARTQGSLRFFVASTQAGPTASAVGSYEAYFTAPSGATGVSLQGDGNGFIGSADNISITEVVADRSFKARDASINGTLTRAQLASGTSLVGFSGFSAANYLRETYSADLDFGTGEWTASAWVNVPALPPADGVELITNGGFDTDVSGWSAVDGSTIEWVDGRLRVVTANINQGARQFITTQVGKAYSMKGNLVSGNGTRIWVGAAAYGAAASFDIRFTATSTSTEIRLSNSEAVRTIEWDNISVKEVLPSVIFDRAAASGPRLRLGVTGTGLLTAEASDGTTTRTVTTSASYNTAQWLKARVNYTTDGTLAILVNGREVAATRGTPLLSLNSRYNQIVYSEDYSNAQWGKGNCVITSTGQSGPYGANNGTLFTFNADGGTGLFSSAIGLSASTVARAFLAHIKYGSWRWWEITTVVSGVATRSWVDLQNGVAGIFNHTNFTVTLLPSGWLRIYGEFGTATLSEIYITPRLGSGNAATATGNNGATFMVGGIDIRPAALSALPYQRVGVATDFDFQAPLTIGNSFALDAPFPGSIALLKLGATVPTPEQATFMYEQEKQMFRAGALSVLPDSGAIVDMAYDDATDRWVAISATNESYWTGLVRNSVQAVPAGSFSRVVAGSGIELAARITTNPGVDVTIPAYGLREELVRRAEAAARLSRELAIYDFVGGFTANTTSGSTAITNVAGLTYPTSYIGARISGAGIPANAQIVGVSGTTIYLSAAATATATGVSVSFLDFRLPVGMEAKAVLSAGALRREGSVSDFVRLYDGFLETIRFAVAPGATAWVQIQATRGTMQ